MINILGPQTPSLGMGDESGAVQDARLGYTAPTYGSAIFNPPPNHPNAGVSPLPSPVQSVPQIPPSLGMGDESTPGFGGFFNQPSNQPAPVQSMPSPVQPTMQPAPNDIFGFVEHPTNNPLLNNPIPPPPTSGNTGHSHNDLLAGLGQLFEQYFSQQGSQQINQPSTQPVFDAAVNNNSGGQTQSNQVFGNMITPNFGSY